MGGMLTLKNFARPTLSVAALWCLFAGTVQCQEPTETERPNPRPLETPTYLPQTPDKTFELPPVKELPPTPDASGPTLEIKSVTFEGNAAIATSELERVAAPYVQRPVTRIELEQLRERISRYYLERGYVNSGAMLPDDFYRDGVVRLQIIEGRIEDIHLTGMGRLRDEYVRERLIDSDEVFNVNVLQERFRLLLTDPLFGKINARLQPGSKLGLATLNLDVTRARAWDLAVFGNNYRSPSVGAEALGATGRVRDLTGLGDAFDASVQGGNRDNLRYGLGWTVPLSTRTHLRLRYDNGKSNVLEEPLETLDIKSELVSEEIGISHTFIETTRRSFSIGLSFTRRKNSTELLGEPFSFVPGEATGTSKIDAWRFDQDFVQRWEKQAFALRSTFTFGKTNTVADAQFEDIVPPKRYAFWLGQMQFTRRVFEGGGDLLLRANMQYSRDRLVSLERFAIGGVSSVRGYRENQAVRDQGFSTSIEFRYPIFDRPANRHRVTLIPFVDYGEAKNKGEERQELASIGLGLNYQLGGLSADLFYGKRLIEPDVKSQGDLQDDGIHFQLRYDF
jgi:hemolysin activation/secretion protein